MRINSDGLKAADYQPRSQASEESLHASVLSPPEIKSLFTVPSLSAQDSPMAVHRSRVADSPLPTTSVVSPRSSLRSSLWASEREGFPLISKDSLVRWVVEFGASRRTRRGKDQRIDEEIHRMK